MYDFHMRISFLTSDINNILSKKRITIMMEITYSQLCGKSTCFLTISNEGC